jgi:hypothetical protein
VPSTEQAFLATVNAIALRQPTLFALDLGSMFPYHPEGSISSSLGVYRSAGELQLTLKFLQAGLSSLIDSSFRRTTFSFSLYRILQRLQSAQLP